MPDLPESTRPRVALVLRESFIALYQRDGQEAALRLLDELAHHITCEERGSYLMGKDEHAIDRSEILGAAGDFRQAADQLRESAKGMAETANEDREVMRVTLALGDASAAVQPRADALDAAVARYLAADLDE